MENEQTADLTMKIAEMVLEGWVLLDEFCPVNGAVPLLQNAAGQKYSVAQMAFVDVEEKHANDRDPIEHSTPSHSLHSSTSGSASQRAPAVTATDDHEKSLLLPDTSSIRSFLDPVEVVKATQQTILRKLHAAEQWLILHGTDKVGDRTTSEERLQVESVLKLIGECGDALLALRRVSGD